MSRILLPQMLEQFHGVGFELTQLDDQVFELTTQEPVTDLLFQLFGTPQLYGSELQGRLVVNLAYRMDEGLWILIEDYEVSVDLKGGPIRVEIVGGLERAIVEPVGDAVEELYSFA